MITLNQYTDLVKHHSTRGACEHSTTVKILDGTVWDRNETRILGGCYTATGEEPICRPGVALFYEMHEARRAITSDFMDSFVYDRTTGIFILNLNRGNHEQFLGIVGMAYMGWDLMGDSDTEKAAGDVVDNGLFIYMSSQVSARVTLGSGVKLTAQEKAIFKDFQMVEL